MFGTWLKKSVGIMLGKGKSERCIYSKNIGLTFDFSYRSRYALESLR